MSVAAANEPEGAAVAAAGKEPQGSAGAANEPEGLAVASKELGSAAADKEPEGLEAGKGSRRARQ